MSLQKESEWEKEFDEVFCKDGMLELVSIMKRNNLLKENIDVTVTGKRSQFLSFIKELLSNRENEIAEEVKVDRDDSWRAYLQKLAWKKEEIDDATEWVDRTPLRLRSNHNLESILKH